METPLQVTLQKLILDRERARVRAIELRRQRLVLENELSSPGIFPSEREYLQQRIQTLSNDEDLLGPNLARLERQITQINLQLRELERGVLRGELQRQALLQARSQQQLSAATGIPASPDQVRRFQQSVRLSGRARNEREATYARLKAQIKRTAIIIVIAGLAIAGIADLLSLIDCGWVVSWLIPIVTWFMARRIRGIDSSIGQIVTAQRNALTALKVMRQRLRPTLAASGQTRLFASAETLELRHVVSNYFVTFIRDEVVAQGLELIPFLDWLPMYLGVVVKVIFNQRQAYQKAQAALVPYRQTLDLLARLEDFEFQYQAARLGVPAPVQRQPVAPITRPAPAPRMELQPA